MKTIECCIMYCIRLELYSNKNAYPNGETEILFFRLWLSFSNLVKSSKADASRRFSIRKHVCRYTRQVDRCACWVSFFSKSYGNSVTLNKQVLIFSIYRIFEFFNWQTWKISIIRNINSWNLWNLQIFPRLFFIEGNVQRIRMHNRRASNAFYYARASDCVWFRRGFRSVELDYSWFSGWNASRAIVKSFSVYTVHLNPHENVSCQLIIGINWFSY